MINGIKKWKLNIKKTELKNKVKILFVCESNLVRSPIAAAICSSLSDNLECHSASALSETSSRLHDRRIEKLLNEHNIEYKRESVQGLSSLNLANYKMIFYLDEESHFQLKQKIPNSTSLFMLAEFSEKKFLINIPDPIEGSISFDEVYELINELCIKLVAVVQSKYLT